MRTLDGALAVQLRAHHPKTEEEHSQRKQYANAKADTPDRLKMVLPSSRQHNQKYRHSEGAAKLI